MQNQRMSSRSQMTQPMRPVAARVAPARAPRRTQRQPAPRTAAPGAVRVLPPAQRSAPQFAPPPVRLPVRRVPAKAARPRNWGRLFMGLGIGGVVFMLMACAAVTLGIGLIYAGGILPGVRAGGVSVGGLSQQSAVAALTSAWQTITVHDGQRAWQIDPAALGITLDPVTTAQDAYDRGRSDIGNALPAILSRADVLPTVHVDPQQALTGLTQFTPQFEVAAVNAGVRLVNGQVEAVPPQYGRSLDLTATLAYLEQNPSAVLADRMLELVMYDVLPTVPDATPMLEQARALLLRSFDVRLYDPVTGDSVYWSAAPEQWGSWLTASPDSGSATGLKLTVNDAPLRAYLNSQTAVLDSSRYLKMDDIVMAVQTAVAQGQTTATARVYHHDRQYIVQPGDSITSIAWDQGVPYLFIQQANSGITGVSVGQTITIPSSDNFMPYPVVADKRIVVSISQQKVRVYENGQLKWDWIASTGISDSPTWTGLYQIISHEPNAYAGNWNLWMPNFMGVYQPIPGSDFTNGFHGFPTRGGSQLLWTNSLGTRVTYGCILLSNDNIKLLYDWAQEGVVVEIQA